MYRLIFRGELLGGPRQDGAVYVSVASLEAHLSGHPTAQADQN